MSTAQREQARRDALRIAAVLRTNTPDDPTIRAAAQLLEDWRAEEVVRDALRPVFAAAVPDQRALIALGDIDAWLSDGRVAREHWESAASGPDPHLAALAADRAGRAHLRAGRREEAETFLWQAATAGVRAASHALEEIAAQRVSEARERREEDTLRLAELCLEADDMAGLGKQLRALGRPDRFGLERRRQGVLGELAFRRGHLAEAADCFTEALGPYGDGPRRLRLRLAQIAIARGDAAGAHEHTLALADDEGELGEGARLLVRLHVDLIVAGWSVDDGLCDCCCDCCCDCGDDGE
ncbi:hypothetical protein WCD74_17190 [Actinomycetospora sp. OC33-EN08]|uniref:Tetratricopeptide repeat protein n=1 Tax=Actinomycetospora aurantiaca TaxID=3129233 RepID=A0ABU8MQF5_9PSEU